MKKLSLISLFVFLLSGTYSQTSTVNGYCFLENASDYSGIKILFEAFSPSGETDSTYTDASGYFELSLHNGIYDISYSKENYETYYIDEQPVTEDLTLDTVTLEYGITKEVSGTQSGIWYSDTIYLVVGNISITFGDTLYIQPGTIIKFMDFFKIESSGQGTCLMANGTNDDHIILTSGFSGNWNLLRARSNGSMLLHFVEIEHCKYCIGTFYTNGGIIIENSRFSKSLVMDLIFQFSDNVKIANNIFLGGGGVIGVQKSSISFINNLFYKTSSNSVYFFSSDMDESKKFLFYNNIFLSLFDLIVENSTGDIFLENNIFASGYNIGYSIPTFGELNTININGDSCDLYYNLFMDPDMVNPPKYGNGYSWFMDANNDITFYLAQLRWTYSFQPYLFLSNNGGNDFEMIEMQLIDDHFEANANLYFFGQNNPPINWVGLGDEDPEYFAYSQLIDFITTPAGPRLDLGNLSGIYDYHLRDSSPAIDAGKQEDKYNDPEDPYNPGMALFPSKGTVINDLGIYGGPNSFTDYKPVPDFELDTNIVVQGEPLYLTNLSQGEPDSFEWSFPGGEPESSNEENPGVIYDSTGFYNISLTAENDSGSNTLNKRFLIFVVTATSIQDHDYDSFYMNIYPNPGSNKVTFDYVTNEISNVEISIWNNTGQEVEKVYSGIQGKGLHKMIWNPDNVESGIYFCKIKVHDQIKIKKVIIIKK